LQIVPERNCKAKEASTYWFPKSTSIISFDQISIITAKGMLKFKKILNAFSYTVSRDVLDDFARRDKRGNKAIVTDIATI